uniref:Uncharacterized protein n=1 Tax=Fagus sylvatica TaxID=28930 RepID=A0A2N9HA16_FAGSY
MLQSILNVESELRLLVASSDWRGLEFNKKDITKVTNIIQSTEFWNQGHEVLLILEPLVRVLRLVVSDGATAGYLYEAMERAKEAIQQRCDNNKDKYIQIWELFESRRSQNIIHPIHAAAAFLNPAYMCSETFMENHEMKEGIRFILENLVAIEEKTTFIRQVKLYRMKVSSLFTATAMTMLEAFHPRLWWHNCGDSIPILKKYAIRILSQSCSSSSCERNWSAFEAAQTKKRNRLESKMLDDLVYMRMNTMMMEKSNTSEGQDLEPIDLDKLNELPEYVDREQDKEDDTLEVHTSESRSLQLKLVNSLSLPVFTGARIKGEARIEGEDCSNIQVALIDALTGQTVITGPESLAKVEIVVLEGDFDGDENDNWTGEEFKNNIVREREGKKPLLTGDAFVNLKEGTGVVGEISFTDNSSWTRSRRFRLTARVVDKIDGTSDFLGHRHAKRGSPNQAGLIRRGLATSNNLKLGSGTHVPKPDQVLPRLTKFDRGLTKPFPTQLGSNIPKNPQNVVRDTFPRVRRALTKFDQAVSDPTEQEGYFNYDVQLPDRQELLRSSRNLDQKMTPLHKEHSNGLCSQDHILRTQARLCARPVPLKSRVFLTHNKLIRKPGHVGKRTRSCMVWNSQIAKMFPGLAGIFAGKMPSDGQKHSGGLCSRDHIFPKPKLGFLRTRNLKKEGSASFPTVPRTSKTDIGS